MIIMDKAKRGRFLMIDNNDASLKIRQEPLPSPSLLVLLLLLLLYFVLIRSGTGSPSPVLNHTLIQQTELEGTCYIADASWGIKKLCL